MPYLSTTLNNLEFALLPLLLAQEPPADFSNDPGAAAGALVSQLFFFLILYVFAAFTCQRIFSKCGVENAWFAWIPILGTYANFKAGDEEQAVLWTILSMVPCINIVAVIKLIIAWVKICNKLGKSPWILLVVLLPIIGTFVCLGYLAFA